MHLVVNYIMRKRNLDSASIKNEKERHIQKRMHYNIWASNHRLAFSLERPSTSRVPGNMGALGKTMRYDLQLRRFAERSAARGLDSPPSRH